MQVKKQDLEPDMEQWTGSKLGKEYDKAVYCHAAYLGYMQSALCDILGQMKHKLASRFPGEISITWYTQMTPPLWQKVKKKWSLVMKLKEESENVDLKLNIQKMKITASDPLTSWQIDVETMETVRDYFSGTPKSLQMVTTVLKLKDPSWKKSYDQHRQHIKKQRHYFADKGLSRQSYIFSW